MFLVFVPYPWLFYATTPEEKEARASRLRVQLGARQSLSGEVPDQQATLTSFLLDESYPMKGQ